MIYLFLLPLQAQQTSGDMEGPKIKTIRVRGDTYETSTYITPLMEQTPIFPYDEAVCNSDIRACSDKACIDFIYDNLEYPSLPENYSGMAVVSFNVMEDDSMANIRLELDPGQGCGAKALEVVQLLQSQITWEPAVNTRGQKSSMRLNIPITFEN
jgi:hypothetical protein